MRTPSEISSHHRLMVLAGISLHHLDVKSRVSIKTSNNWSSRRLSAPAFPADGKQDSRSSCPAPFRVLYKFSISHVAFSLSTLATPDPSTKAAYSPSSRPPALQFASSTRLP